MSSVEKEMSNYDRVLKARIDNPKNATVQMIQDVQGVSKGEAKRHLKKAKASGAFIEKKNNNSTSNSDDNEKKTNLYEANRMDPFHAFFTDKDTGEPKYRPD